MPTFQRPSHSLNFARSHPFPGIVRLLVGGGHLEIKGFGRPSSEARHHRNRVFKVPPAFQQRPETNDRTTNINMRMRFLAQRWSAPRVLLCARAQHRLWWRLLAGGGSRGVKLYHRLFGGSLLNLNFSTILLH